MSITSKYQNTSKDWKDSKEYESKIVRRIDNTSLIISSVNYINSSEVTKKILELSRIPGICKELRLSGHLASLVHMLSSESDEIVYKQISMALYNIIYNHPIEKSTRREMKILKLLEQLIAYSKMLKSCTLRGYEINDSSSATILTSISSLMRISFDEEHKRSMCTLGALEVISNILYLDYVVHGSTLNYVNHNSFRRYALMALTNLTFGDELNKSILCKQREFMQALVAQLETASDDLLQVTSTLIRNLSWRADNNTKKVLNEIGTVAALVHVAMRSKNENTLKAILSAIWNLSAHCSKNKAEFCAVRGALAFLVDMLTYESPSKTLKIVENAGGILRNVSSHIAVREDYRQILRTRNCLLILLEHLKSESLTIVSNSCGSLWNLSARCHEDQQILWNNGAVSMLRSLIHSKHIMISEGSAAALKNLLHFRATLQTNNSNLCTKKISLLTESKKLSLPCTNKSRTNEHLKYSASILKYYRHSKSRSLDSLFFNSNGVVYKKEKDFLLKCKSYSLECFENIKKNDIETYDLPIIRSYNYTMLRSNISNIGILTTTDAQFKNSMEKSVCTSSYQETDLDQITNFSLRYAESQIETDTEAITAMVNCTPNNHYNSSREHINVRKLSKCGEILLTVEDSVKCYETEDTPYMTSNSTSVNDLTNNKTDNTHLIVSKFPRSRKYKKCGSGFDTPENPISYCEEGTPDIVSSHESLNSLLDVNQRSKKQKKKVYYVEESQIKKKIECTYNINNISEKPHSAIILNKNKINSAQETPLMFSRRSSIDSLREIDIATYDDISSIQSDFSRLASGVISPDIPDSPTQIEDSQIPIKLPTEKNDNFNNFYNMGEQFSGIEKCRSKPMPLNNVFEDNLNTFNIENTPAQFSSATSLSNLSSVEEENVQIDFQLKPSLGIPYNISEGEEEETHKNYDEVLLASCIDIGMNRMSTSGLSKKNFNSQVQITRDEIKEYFTEDTPALFSNEGSNTNLSAISIPSSKIDGQLPKPKKDCVDLSQTDPFLEKVLQQKSNESFAVSKPKKMENTPLKLDYIDFDHKCMNNSLSSLSIDSDDDNHLLSQIIAAGYNRPKSNLGFTGLCANKHSTLSKSQTFDKIAIRSSLRNNENNEDNSLSSNYSSDSNDNQSKSLLELCIRTGMNKSQSYKNIKQNFYKKYHRDQKNVQMMFAQSNPDLPPLGKKKKMSKAKTEKKLLMDCIKDGITNKTGNSYIRGPKRKTKSKKFDK